MSFKQKGSYTPTESIPEDHMLLWNAVQYQLPCNQCHFKAKNLPQLRDWDTGSSFVLNGKGLGADVPLVCRCIDADPAL